jgi:hypothetical protein
MPATLNTQALLLSSLTLVIIVPFILIALFIILRLLRQRTAARSVGVNGSIADAVLGGLRGEVQSTLLAREEVNNRLRATGEEARAAILTVMDTSIRIGDQASMLRFSVEVFPTGRPPFRAETQQAVSDATRDKFMPGSNVFVKFDPADITQVALDRPVASAPKASVVACPSCGAAQHVTEGMISCSYCNRPLAAS